MLFEKCVRAELGLRCIPECAGWKRGKLEEDCALECVIWADQGPYSWEILREVKGETIQERLQKEVPEAPQVVFPDRMVETVHLAGPGM